MKAGGNKKRKLKVANKPPMLESAQPVINTGINETNIDKLGE